MPTARRRAVLRDVHSTCEEVFVACPIPVVAAQSREEDSGCSGRPPRAADRMSDRRLDRSAIRQKRCADRSRCCVCPIGPPTKSYAAAQRTRLRPRRLHTPIPLAPAPAHRFSPMAAHAFRSALAILIVRLQGCRGKGDEVTGRCGTLDLRARFGTIHAAWRCEDTTECNPEETLCQRILREVEAEPSLGKHQGGSAPGGSIGGRSVEYPRADVGGYPKPCHFARFDMAGQRLRHMLVCSALQAIARRLPNSGPGWPFVGSATNAFLLGSDPTPERDAPTLAVHEIAHWTCMSCKHHAADKAISSSLLKGSLRRMCHRSGPFQSFFARAAGAARDDP